MALLMLFSCEPIDNIDSIEVLQQRKQAQQAEPEPEPEPEPTPEPEPEPTPVEVTKTLTASPSTFDVEAAGGQLTAEVKSNCDWTVSSNASWCRLSATSGNGNAQLVMTVDENTSEDSRTATVTITYDSKTVTLTVTQKGKENTQRDPSGDDNTPPEW